MSVKRFFFIFVIVYFLISAVITYNDIGFLPALNVLVIGGTIMLYMLGIIEKDGVKLGAVISLVIGLCFIIFYLFPDLYNKSQGYLDAMNLTFSRDTYYGKFGDRVLIKCGVQGYFDNIILIFECFKIVYFDVFMSGVDIIFNQFHPLPENACFVAVKDLIVNYPEVESKLPKELLDLISDK